MKKFLLLNLLLLTFTLVSSAQKPKAHKDVSVAKLERKLKRNNVQLVDVRTAKEFGEQCVDGAQNFNVEAADFGDKIQKLDKNKPVYVYCRTGKRSDKAAKKMEALGFKKIYDVKGGITAWNERKAKLK